MIQHLITLLFVLLACKPEGSPTKDKTYEDTGELNHSVQPSQTSQPPSSVILSQVDTNQMPVAEFEAKTYTLTLSGTVTFDLVDNSNGFWDYENSIAMPVKKCKVLVTDNSGKVVAVAFTDLEGKYSISTEVPSGDYFLIAVAETEYGAIRVQDNVQANSVYGVNSELFSLVDRDIQLTLDMRAESGWSGTNAEGSYLGPRASAPFAIIHYIQLAEQKFMGNRKLSPLIVNWSSNNRSVSGDKTKGEIGTSHWDGQQMYLRGEVGVNADEYDSHVIIHEWMHYFHDAVGRSDSPGGSHNLGEAKDPRLSFSEGLANAGSCLALGQGSFMIDVYGPKQNLFFGGIDLEDRSSYPATGWYSEMALSYLLYDFFDLANDADDLLGFDPDELGDLLMDQAATAVPSTIFSFVDSLKKSRPAAVSEIVQMAHATGIQATDKFGASELDNGGISGALPPVNQMEIDGGSINATVLHSAGTPTNSLSSSRLFYFHATVTRARLVISGVAGSLIVKLYNKGGVIKTWAISGDFQQNLELNTGENYSINTVLVDGSSLERTFQIKLESLP